jgi:hypothetical protein
LILLVLRSRTEILNGAANRTMQRYYFFNHGGEAFQPGTIIKLESLVVPESGPRADEWKNVGEYWNGMFPLGLSVWGRRLLLEQIKHSEDH